MKEKVRDPLKEACVYSQEHSEECKGVSLKEIQTNLRVYNYFKHNRDCRFKVKENNDPRNKYMTHEERENAIERAYKKYKMKGLI